MLSDYGLRWILGRNHSTGSGVWREGESNAQDSGGGDLRTDRLGILKPRQAVGPS